MIDMTPRYRVLLGDVSRVEIVLVGCGGTGSFLALHLARLAWHAAARGLRIDLTFIDPDTVEEKNVGRQNFCPAEVGEHKAATLARRFSLAFGRVIEFSARPFDRNTLEARLARGLVQIIAGCVDNPAARREIAESQRSVYNTGRVWWIDGGNHWAGGQVHIGNGDRVEINPLGFCTMVPTPAVQAPDLVADPELQAADDGNLAELSCAELAAMDAQGLMVNQAIAGWMATYLYRLLITQDLDIAATYVDLTAGSARSVAIERFTGEEAEDE